MTVTVYRSTDTSAPVLDNTVGSLINLLDKCLVSGYGSQTAAGWSKPFTGTNLAAFQQGVDGDRPQNLLRVDDTYGAYVLVNGYETMSSISAGTNVFPSADQVSTTGLYMLKGSNETMVCYCNESYFLLLDSIQYIVRWKCFWLPTG